MLATFRIEVIERDASTSIHNKWVHSAHQLGVKSLTGCIVARVFFVRGDITPQMLETLANQLLCDPVTEEYHLIHPDTNTTLKTPEFPHYVDVTYHPGVTDPAAENLVRAAHEIGIHDVIQAASGSRYSLCGAIDSNDIVRLAEKLFANTVIEKYSIDELIWPAFLTSTDLSNPFAEYIAIREADDEKLLSISAERRLSLNLEEMRAIRNYYQTQGRDISDVEIEMIAQTWSEHCVHKTFKAIIDYIGPEPNTSPNSPPTQQIIEGLLNTYIRRATETLNKSWVRSAFVDNAGIIRFDDQWDLAFKVETHNHPSAIEPFGGANTGVGGVIRDVLGVSARPIANTDILCFGYPQTPDHKIPHGIHHPRRIATGVVHGIEDYGNKMGIPTVNGAILYHDGYTANPLVFCGCLGILPHASHPTEPQNGDFIVVIGGRTGRDGLRGATFSSMEMDVTTSDIASVSVQIGHPINEKQILEVILQARDENLYNAITDCGAGGLSSAIGEMAKDLGATVQLDKVLLKYDGLRPWEIWLSEAQERMVLAISPQNWQRLQSICQLHHVEAVHIGYFEATKRLKLFYKETLVGDISLDFLHNGLPQRRMSAIWAPLHDEDIAKQPEPPDNYADILLKLLTHPNIHSKEETIRRYDHEVQGGTIIKPLVGQHTCGPSDAAVIVPLDTGHKPDPTGAIRGIALSNGICPQYGVKDPYAMAWSAIDEALRNLICVGADPDQIAILDNFCWGNPNLPDRLGALVRCAQGCYSAALAYQTPFISGKDSLNNEYTDENGQRHAIPGTLLISAVGVVPNIKKSVTMDLKSPNNVLFIIGQTRDELGASHYNQIVNRDFGTVPQPTTNPLSILRAIYQAIQAESIQACHDISEGGLIVALAEMCIAGGLGIEARIDDKNQHIFPYDAQNDVINLFSETNTRFIVEVHPNDITRFQNIMSDVPHAPIGIVTTKTYLSIDTMTSGKIIDLPISALEAAWRAEKSSPKNANSAKLIPYPASKTATTKPKALILHAPGTNRDRDAALACEMAGGQPEIVTVDQLAGGEKNLSDYQLLILPGGFSYGDDLGAGVLWATDMQFRLVDQLHEFVESGRPVLGICNGFQALVKAGMLPHLQFKNKNRNTTLTYNEKRQFECRWVYLKPNIYSQSPFLKGIDELLYCPVAHGEGRIAISDKSAEEDLQRHQLVAFTYVDSDGNPADYPYNPNGSLNNIAALTNVNGNVLGLMPHPENHIFPWQHPRWHRGERGGSGLLLFQNALSWER